MRAGLSRTVLAVLLPVLLAGCESEGEDLPPLPPSTTVGQAYLLGAGDKLQIVIFNSADTASGIAGTDVGSRATTGSQNDQYTVGETGLVAAPLVGEVKAAGLTVEQVRKAIVDKLSQGYLRNPKVSVEIAVYRPFYVLGEVTHGGAFPYVPHMTVRSAVATAGGFTYRAIKDWAVVDRKDGDTVIRGRATPDTPIQPDDVVTVSERYF